MNAEQDQGRIVVGVDGSAHSAAALRQALRQAWLTGAAVDAVACWQWPATDGGLSMTSCGCGDRAEPTGDAARAAVAAAVEDTSQAAQVEVQVQVVQGYPAAVLLDVATGADLLVVGSRGHGELRGMMLGSVGCTAPPTPPARFSSCTATRREGPLTTSTEIDRSAPVIAHHEIDIAASLDDVWQLHVHVDGWPAWQPEVTAAHLDGAFTPGAAFTWTSYDFPVTSTVYDIVDHARTLWGGEAQGVLGTHEWAFRRTAAGVHASTTESFSGSAVAADPATFQNMLDASLTTWLRRLQEKAESASGAT